MTKLLNVTCHGSSRIGKVVNGSPLRIKSDTRVLPRGLGGPRLIQLSSDSRAGEAFMLMYF
jgi:hypothetical protein